MNEADETAPAEPQQLIVAGYSCPQVVKDGRKIPVWFEGALAIAAAAVVTGCAGTAHALPPQPTTTSAPQSVVGPIAL